MKPLLVFIILSTTFVSVFGQTQWLKLTYPESGILGKAVLCYRDGNINYDPVGPSLISPKVDISTSADDLTEYNERFRNFVTRYFTSNRFHLTEVKSKKLVIKSLNIEEVIKLREGKKYVYSAISADSVEITTKVKKGQVADISKLMKDVSSLVTGVQTAGIVEKVVSFLDSISYSNEDSVAYKMTVANPDVFYKIKIIKFENLARRDWERYWKFFTNPSGRITNNGQPEPTFNLIYTPLETTNSTNEIYPEFWGPKDPNDVRFRLTAKKINDSLRLFIQYRGRSFNNQWNDVEIAPRFYNGKRYWVFDRSLIYTFDFRNTTKMVYIQVRGEENGPDKIKITSWSPLIKDKMTFMQYPEIKLKYVDR